MNGEHSSEASELDGLPDADRKETQEIIDEIGQDENKGADGQSGNDEKKGEEKPADDSKEKKDDDKSDDDSKGKDDKKTDPKPEPPRKPVKLMPSYVHEIAQKKANDRIAELEAEISKAKDGKGSDSAEKKEPNADQKKALEDRIKEIAEKRKLDPDTVRDLVDLGMEFGGKLPAEVEEKLKKVDAFTADIEAKAEETAFNAAFDEHVMPLVKAEFGPDVAADTISAIRDAMKEKAYSKEFAQTPYSVIYKGVDDFRKFARTTSKSAEGSKGGAHSSGADGDSSAASEEAERFTNATDADIDKMDGPTFDRFSAWQQSRERNKG